MDVLQKIQDSLTFSKRPGTTDKGKEYEKYLLTSFILKFLKSDDLTDFRIWSNDKAFGDFDDVILHIKNKNGSERKYALQLKHVNNKNKKLSLESFKAEKGDFAIRKYFKSYQRTKLTNCSVILWTNLNFTASEGTIIEFVDEEMTYSIEIVKSDRLPLLSTTKNTKWYRFKILGESSSKYEKFFQNFFLSTNQIHFDQLKESVADNFIQYVNNWILSEGKLHKLDKTLMEKVVALQLLNGHIYPLCFETTEGNIFQDTINKFDVTVFKKSSLEGVRRIWHNDKEKFCHDQEAGRLLRLYQLSRYHLDDISSSILLWLLDERPLIVEGRPQTYDAIRLCKGKKFVLIEDNLDFGALKELQIFRKVSDLKQFGNTFTAKIYLKTPGKEINLHTLIQKDSGIADVITTDDLMKMINQKYIIEQEKEKLPDTYVSRCLYRNFISSSYLEQRTEDVVVLISNLSKENENFDCFKKDRQIYINRHKTSQEEFHKLCSQTQNRKEHHHFEFTNGRLKWLKSVGGVSSLDQYSLEEDLLPEDEFLTEATPNNVNIIIGDPGMGKSVLLKKLKNSALSQYLTLLLTPKDISRICRLKESLPEIIFAKCSTLDKKILTYLMGEGEVIYLWDALDEISDEERTTLMNIITDLSEKSKMQVLTSRQHLRNILQDRFGVLARSIRPFDTDQQTYCIEHRLRDVIPTEELPNITRKIKDNYCHVDILGIPLQIFMITELFLKNPDKYGELFTDLFSLTDLYHYFIEEKFSLFFKEKLSFQENSHQNQRLLETFKNQRIKNYKAIAMKAIFGEKFPIEYEDFPDGDSVGLIVEVAEFIHKSYAEYFAALYLVDNCRTFPNLEILFSRRYTNVRFFFDMLLAKESPAHLAVLYKNLTKLEEFEDLLERNDLEGRNLLHLACSWSERYPLLSVKKKWGSLWYTTYLVDNQTNYSTKTEDFNYQQLLTYLLEKCNPHQKDSLFGFTSMEYAEKFECLFAIALIEEKLKVNYFSSKDNKFLCNLLYYGAKYNFPDTIETIKYICDDNNESLLHIAARNNNIKCLQKLLLQTSYKQNIDTRNNNTETPLLIAVKNGHFEIASLLIKSGANVEAGDDYERRPLIWAINRQYKDTTKLLINSGAKINSTTLDNYTPICVASSNGDSEIVQLLIDKGADLNCGEPPFLLPSQNGHFDVVNMLIEKGVDVNASTDDELTSLFLASQNGHSEIVGILLNHGATLSPNTLYIAAQEGHSEIVRLLISNGADIEEAQPNGATPLLIASQMGHSEVVRILIESGSKVDVEIDDGLTPLWIATEGGHVEVVKILIGAKANIHVGRKTTGATPLYVAAEEGHLEIIQILIENGAEVDSLTPLFLAIQNGHLDVVRVLIENGVNVNTCRIEDGATPLLIATQTEQLEIIKILINEGADINAALREGATPLYIASQDGCLDIVKFLVENGANVNAAKNNATTPLLMASQKGHVDVIKTLIQNGADIDTVADNGATPLYIACETGHLDVVKVLIENMNHERDDDFLTPLVNVASQEGHSDIINYLEAVKQRLTQIFCK